jgi:hypothetical protein
MRLARTARRAVLILTLSALPALVAVLMFSGGPSRGYHAVARLTHARSTPDQVLAAALSRAMPHRTQHLAVSVLDTTTSVTASYHGSQSFPAANLVRADILAVLQLQHQQIGAALSNTEQKLATAMIEDGDENATATLWDDDEGGEGLEAGDYVLGLRATPTSSITTVADQLRLLTDLTSARSSLSAPARQYELGLMRHVTARQRWGVTAAADAGTHSAVMNGWLAVSPGERWEINSIGVISHAHHRLLIAVLSDGYPTQAAGIQVAQTAANTAASAITSLR